MWPSIISADRAEVGWWAGWGQPNWFPDQSSLHILMSKASPMPFANQTKVFLETSSQTTGQGVFFPGCWRRNSLSTWRSQISFNLTPLKCSFQKASYVPIPTSFKKTVEGTMQTRPLEGLQNPFFKMLLRGLCQTFIWKSSSKTLPQGTAPARWQLLRGWLQAAPAQVNFEIPHLEAATGQVAPVAWGIGCFACQFSFASNESLEVSWNHRKFDDLAQEVYLYIQYVFWFHLGMSYGIMIQKASLLIIPGPP